jgi:hypothetical protein
MNESRLVLKPRPLLQLSAATDPEVAVAIVQRAIAKRTCILAIYNKGRVKLAPYVLYERDDAAFLDAVTIERDGRPPREPKLGAFRVSGLSELVPTVETFDPEVEVALGDVRYTKGILAHLQLA